MITSVTPGNKALILGTLLLVSSSGQAHLSEAAAIDHACDSPSPSLLQLGEERYYAIAPVKAALTPGEIAQLETLYDRLQGRWRGEWNDYYCLAGDRSDSLQVNSREYKRVTAGVRQHGKLSFRADGLRIDLAAASELTSLEFVGEETVVMTLRTQRGSVPQLSTAISDSGSEENVEQPAEKPGETPGQSALRERHDTLTLQGRKLRLETKWFVNGYYSGSELTTLQRVR